MKRVLITGAGSGFGLGSALGLAKVGHYVFATVRRADQVGELQAIVAKLGLQDRVTVEKLDLLEEADRDAAIAWDFDTYVANAGIGEGGPIAEVPMDRVRSAFETNVFCNLALTQKIVRKFIDAGTKGRLIFVSSMGGLMSVYGLAAYGATKHALEAIAFNLSEELAEHGITVQTINPGPYRTGFNDRMAERTFDWLDPNKHVSKEAEVRSKFAAMMDNQFDPQEMINKMVEIIGADTGLYRNVWPPQIEALVKKTQGEMWTKRIG